jgi:hypothetical protein
MREFRSDGEVGSDAVLQRESKRGSFVRCGELRMTTRRVMGGDSEVTPFCRMNSKRGSSLLHTSDLRTHFDGSDERAA